MGRTNWKHSILTIALLMALALYGMVVVKFIAACVACMFIAAILFGLFLLFFLVMDKIINFFYTAR